MRDSSFALQRFTVRVHARSTRLQHAGSAFGLHAVAEVEDVARVVRPPRCRRARRRCRPSAMCPASTSAGSRLPCTTRSAPSRARAAVIEVRQSRPSTSGRRRASTRAGDRSRCRSGSRPRRGGWRPAREHGGGVGQHERVVVGAARVRRPTNRTAETPRRRGRAGRRSRQSRVGQDDP